MQKTAHCAISFLYNTAQRAVLNGMKPMDSNTNQLPQSAEQPALDLDGVPYIVDNLREWAAEFRASLHPVTLTLFRAIHTLEKLDRAVTAHKCGERDKQLTIEWLERQLADQRRVLAAVAKHADFSQCPPHLEEDVDRLLRGEGGPSS